MKMRSIALVAAVFAISIGALSATQSRPSESDLAGGTGVPASPISAPAASTMGAGPGAATMPMAPGIQRMPSGISANMGTLPAGYQYVPGRGVVDVKTGAMVAGLDVLKDLIKEGVSIGDAFAKLEIEKQTQAAKDNQEKRKREDQRTERQNIIDSIKNEIKIAQEGATTAIATARKEVNSLNTKMNIAAGYGINAEESDNQILSSSRATLKEANTKVAEATTSLTKALKEAEIAYNDEISFKFNEAKNLADSIDLTEVITIWDGKINSAKAEKARAAKAGTTRTSYGSR